MTHSHTHDHSPAAGRGLGFLAGALFGGLAGAATALLLAPRPGRETRRLIRDQVETAREQAALSLDEARANAEDTVQAASRKVEQLQTQGRALLRRNVSRVQATAAAVQAAAQEAWNAGREKRAAIVAPTRS